MKKRKRLKFTVELRDEVSNAVARLGQNELARRAGIDKALMSRYLGRRGHSFFSAKSLDRLAAAAGITVVRRSELQRLRAIERSLERG
jgi:transcriptional regulator with XRE-family HTH domain